MRQVIVTKTAADKMRGWMAGTCRTETGGVLVGRIENETMLVTDASGPGPRAELWGDSVLIDGAYAQLFCDRASRSSGGHDDYVGDWHCHLACSYQPSPRDLIAMETMADFPGSPTKNPISLIWAKYRGCFAVYLFTDERRLKRIRCSILQSMP